MCIRDRTETENVAQEVQTEDSELEQKGIEIQQKNLNWKKLKGVNQDIYAWIYIPGTGVDYPVLQHPSDDSYYLNYNMNGTRAVSYTHLAFSTGSMSCCENKSLRWTIALAVKNRSMKSMTY